MKILALEFSSSQRSVAVVSSHRQDETSDSSSGRMTEKLRARAIGPVEINVSEIVESAPGSSMRPLSMVEEALTRAGLEREEIECVAVGLGPGSYTGMRVAIALAQGWQLACGVKLLGISSAECIAAEAQGELSGKCCVVLDAQRGEFYLASYQICAIGLREVQTLKLATLAEAREREKAGEILIGPEVSRWFPNGRCAFPRAARLVRLALERQDFVAGEKLEPLYLRETQFVKSPPPRILL